MNYNGLYTYFETNDPKFFYDNLDKIINLDRNKIKCAYEMLLDQDDNYLRTNNIDLFLEMLYKTLVLLKDNKEKIGKKNCLFIKINISDLSYEKKIWFDKSNYIILERTVKGEGQDSYNEDGIIYDPSFDKKQIENINDLVPYIVKSITNVLKVKYEEDVEFDFGGEFHDHYIEIPKTFDRMFFEKQLEKMFEQYKDGRNYFEGHILITYKENYYEIEFLCDSTELTIIPEGEDKIVFKYLDSVFTSHDEYTEEDALLDEHTFDEFLLQLNQSIVDGIFCVKRR